jgi:hypothetical protein
VCASVAKASKVNIAVADDPPASVDGENGNAIMTPLAGIAKDPSRHRGDPYPRSDCLHED